MLKKTSRRFVFIVTGLLGLFGGVLATAQLVSDQSGPVMNYHQVDDRIVTGGHLIDDGAAVLKESGVNVVINLLDEPPDGEEARFTEQGIEWINIPVEWENPTKAAFQEFSEVMRKYQNERVLVQCYLNYRASAMTYLYQVVVDEVPEDEARTHVIWDPSEYPAWSALISDILSE